MPVSVGMAIEVQRASSGSQHSASVRAFRESERDKDGEHGGSAMGNQRQWNSHNREEPDDHPHVDREIQEEYRHYTADDQAGKGLAHSRQHVDQNQQQQGMQADHGHGARESELFCQRGKNEIGVLLRQEVEIGLRTAHVAAPPKSSGAEGDFGLQLVVSRAERVKIGIQEDIDALVLVVAKNLPAGIPGLPDGDQSRPHRPQWRAERE